MIKLAMRALLALAILQCGPALSLASPAAPPVSYGPFVPGTAVEGWDTAAGAACFVGSTSTCSTAPGLSGSPGGGGSSGPVYGADTVGAAPSHAPVYGGGLDPSGNLQGLQLDANKNLLTHNFSPPNFLPAQVNLTTTATSIVAARSGRVNVTIYNTSSSTEYVGPAGVTASTGFPVPAGQAVSIATQAAMYGLVASGTATAAEYETF